MTRAAADLHKEALRQQMLLRALFGDARPGVVAGWLRERPARVERGLQAYRANAGALAEKVLAATFPTLALLLGSEAAAGLARAHWRAEPPLRGDMAQWGEGLPAFIAADPQLASEPYLADVARLDWAVHHAEMAAEAPAPTGLEWLASDEPAALRLQMAPGTALVSSTHPIVAIWRAHRPGAAGGEGGEGGEGHDRFAAVRAAFAAGRGENALVVRGAGDWHATVLALAPADAAFTRAVLAGRCLGDALGDALTDAQAQPDAAFDFEHWLIDNLQHRRIAAVIQQDPP
jgi:Putative DNA-binding domain